MKKFLRSLIPIITLMLFIFIMLSGNYLKKPRDSSEDVVSYITLTLEDVKNDNWDNVKDDVIKLENAWNKIIPRIQFSVEIDEIHNLSINIARVKGAVPTKDKSSILMELNAALENWKELTR